MKMIEGFIFRERAHITRSLQFEKSTNEVAKKSNLKSVGMKWQKRAKKKMIIGGDYEENEKTNYN